MHQGESVVRTTKNDFEYFKKRCLYWAKEFGLLYYQLNFLHEKLDEAQASYYIHEEASACVVALNTEWVGVASKNKKALNRISFHEMFEITLFGLRGWAGVTVNMELLDRETHKIVRTIENLVLGTEV